MLNPAAPVKSNTVSSRASGMVISMRGADFVIEAPSKDPLDLIILATVTIETDVLTGEGDGILSAVIPSPGPEILMPIGSATWATGRVDLTLFSNQNPRTSKLVVSREN